MIFVRKHIPSKLLQKRVFAVDIEGLFIELNFRKCQWLLFGTYHPPSWEDQYYCNNLDEILDTYCQYDKVLLSGDFNSEMSEVCFDSFLYQHDLKNLVKEKTCFKNVSNPTYIDLSLTNQVFSFQNIINVATGLSDFHKLILTVLKTSFSKNKSKKISYRDYKNFNSNIFYDKLHYVFSNLIIDTCDKFDKVFLEILNKHAPLRKKLLRANHALYISKAMWKTIMKRSSLEKKVLKKEPKSL